METIKNFGFLDYEKSHVFTIKYNIVTCYNIVLRLAINEWQLDERCIVRKRLCSKGTSYTLHNLLN